MRTAAERAEQDCRRIVGEKSLMYAGVVALGALDDFCRADYAAAMPKSRRALALLEPILPPEALTRVQAEALLGLSLTRLGQPVEGEPPLRAAYDHGGKVDKVEFVHTIGNLEAALCECLLAQKRYVEAEPLLLTGFVDLEKRLGPQNGLTLQARQHLHDLYLAWNKTAEAARYQSEAASLTTPAP